jgi:aminopeptidase N
MKRLFVFLLYLSTHLGLVAQQIDIYRRPVKFEPDRDFDALHYKVILDVDIQEKQLTGQNTITLTPLRSDLNIVTLDAVSLVVSDVLDSKGFPLSYKQGNNKLHIDLSRSYSHRDTLTFTVKYFLKEQVSGLKFIDQTETNPFQVSSDC